MRHVSLLFLALLFLALLPAAAQAAAVGHAVKQKPEDVRAYWTEERMRDAKPKQNKRPGEPTERAKPVRSGGTGFQSGAVSWTEEYAPTHGKVFFTDNGAMYQCSGTAVDTPSGKVVLTAGHCVHDGEGAFYTDWVFHSAYRNTAGLPSVMYVAASLYTSAEWAGGGEFGRDVGAARVTQTFGSDATPRRAVDTSTPSAGMVGRDVRSYGYPAEGKFNGQVLRYCAAKVSRVDTGPAPDTMALPCDMNGGSSGGGWVSGGSLVSVNSYGYTGLKNTMFGPTLFGTDDVLTAADQGGATISDLP